MDDNQPDLTQLLDAGPVQLWTARPNGELNWVNSAVLEYFGRSFDEMIEWGWVNVLHPEDLEETGERWSKSLESGEPYEVRFRLRQHDGTFRRHVGRARPHREHGKIVLWIGANMDVEPT